jgi:signal transduction histidine kinase/streptogramin lyase
MAGEDRHGNFWVATSSALDRFDRVTGKVLLHIPLGDSGMGLWFHEDRYGVFWVIYGADGKLAVLDRNANRLSSYRIKAANGSLPSTGPFYTMLEDRQGTMWFGTGGTGVLKFDREHNQFISYSMRPGASDSLADTRVTTLFQDREGNIWTGLHQAEPNFFSADPAPFEKFTFEPGNPDSLGSALVSVIYPDRNGSVWIGTDRSIQYLDRKTGRYSRFSLIHGNEVLSMVEERPDVLWFGTAGQGLKSYNRKTGKLKTYRHDANPFSIDSDFIDKMAKDRDGILWLATWDGLSRFDPQTERFTNYKPDVDSRGLNYHAIATAEEGVVWLGSNLGLHRFQTASGHFTVFQHDPGNRDSLSDNRVNTIHQSRDGGLWVGTQNGLDKFDPQSARFRHFSERDGMAGNVVSCILEDDAGQLWMSTNRGVSQFNPVLHQFKNYTFADGLPGPDLTGWGACAKSKSGEMFFGGFSGATAFYPEKVTQNSYVPPTVLTDFRLFGSAVSLSPGSPLKTSITHASSVTLSPAQNIFSIEFSALSYSNPAMNRYRYKLDGLQRQWSEVGSDQRLATYTTLPAGTYTFRVQGATSHRTWSEPGAVLRIEILPAWWATWSFETSCFVLVLILIWSGYRYRVHQLTQEYNLRFDERVGERTRIARELHDTLLQGFQGLMFRLQAVRDLLPEHPQRAIPVLDTALGRGDDVIIEARNTVQGLRSSSAVHNDLAQGITSIADELENRYRTGGSVAGFRLLTEGRPQRLDPILQDEIYQIAREALSNAFEHAHARNIEAEVIYGEASLVLRFRDDGCGIDAGILRQGYRSGHWGLPGIRERTERLGGRVELWSQPAAGTEIAITLPSSFSFGRSSTKRGLRSSRRSKEVCGT